MCVCLSVFFFYIYIYIIVCLLLFPFILPPLDVLIGESLLVKKSCNLDERDDNELG